MRKTKYLAASKIQLDSLRKLIDQATAKETRLSGFDDGKHTDAQIKIANQQLAQTKKQHKDALDKARKVNAEIAQKNDQYEQDRRRIHFRTPDAQRSEVD